MDRGIWNCGDKWLSEIVPVRVQYGDVIERIYPFGMIL